MTPGWRQYLHTLSLVWPGVLVFLLAAVLLFAGQAQAGFSVQMSPARLEVQADPGKTVRAAIKLRTQGRGSQKVAIGKGHFGLDDSGAPVFDHPRDAARSAAAWITVNPNELTIMPMQEKIVRLEITVPPATPSGGYRAAIFISSPTDAGRLKERGATIFLQGRLAFLIYVTVGSARPDGQIKAWEWRRLNAGKQDSLALQVHNQGEAHLRLAGIVQVVDDRGEKFDAIVPGVPILPGQRTWVALDFPEKSPVPGSAVTISGKINLGRGEQSLNAHVEGKR